MTVTVSLIQSKDLCAPLKWKTELYLHDFIIFCALQDMSVDAFSGLVTLRWISLIGNCLRTLPTGLFGSQTNLEVVDLRYNQLQYINMQSLNQLHLLDLSHNPLTSIRHMKLGRNQKDAVFAFKNTSIEHIHYCYEELSPENSVAKTATQFATFYIGTGKSIPCSCELLALGDLVHGDCSITPAVDRIRLRTCQQDKNLMTLYVCPR